MSKSKCILILLVIVLTGSFSFAQVPQDEISGSVWVIGKGNCSSFNDDIYGLTGSFGCDNYTQPYSEFNITYMKKVPGVKNAIAVASNGSSGVAVIKDGSVMAWGGKQIWCGGEAGPLYQVEGLSEIVSVTSMNGYYVFIKSNGTVYKWNGPGLTGRWSTPSCTDVTSPPEQIAGLNDIVKVTRWSRGINRHLCYNWSYKCDGILALHSDGSISGIVFYKNGDFKITKPYVSLCCDRFGWPTGKIPFSETVVDVGSDNGLLTDAGDVWHARFTANNEFYVYKVGVSYYPDLYKNVDKLVSWSNYAPYGGWITWFDKDFIKNGTLYSNYYSRWTSSYGFHTMTIDTDVVDATRSSTMLINYSGSVSPQIYYYLKSDNSLCYYIPFIPRAYSVFYGLDVQQCFAEGEIKLGNGSVGMVIMNDNAPPTADAGPDQTMECAGTDGTLITLDGSGSSDPDGDLLTYTWTGAFGSTTGNPVNVALPLGSYAVTLTVDDGNGNTASDEVIITIRDSLPPVITVSGIQEGSVYALGLVPPANYEVSDTCSGVAISSDSLTGGDGLGLGAFVYTVTATDNAGNAATASVTYDVIATPEGLAVVINELVASGQIDPNIAGSLLPKLKGAQSANTATAADGKLQAFINQVNAQVGKKITPEAAAILINAARYMRANN
jgi:hypothetical protein